MTNYTGITIVSDVDRCAKCDYKMNYIDGWVFVDGQGWICDLCNKEE